jgi:hypothetical protein
MEISAVINKLTRWGFGVAAATASLGLFVATASAQLAPPPAAPKAPAPPAATPSAPAAPAAKAPAPAAPKAAAKTEKKAVSPCKGLDETACKANAECSYVVPTKANKATGKVQAAYCKKSTPPPAAKKAAAPKTPAPSATTTAPAAPKAPTAVAPKTPAPGGAVPKPQ